MWSSSRSWVFQAAFGGLDGLDDRELIWRGLSSWMGRIDPAVTVLDSMKRVDEQAIAALLVRWFHPGRMVAVALHPMARAHGPTPGSSGPVARLDAPALPPWHVPVVRSPLVRKETLPNGLQAWVARDDSLVLVRTALLSRGGWSTSPSPGDNEVLDVLERYDLPTPLGEIEWETAIETWFAYGARVNAIETVGPSSSLDVALWVQRGLSSRLIMDFSERQTELDPWIEATFGVLRELPTATADATRASWLLPGDRTGLPWWERMRQARSVPQGEVLRWQRAVRRPDASVLLVQGPVDEQKAWPSIRSSLTGWKGRGKPMTPSLPPLPAPPARKVYALPFSTSLSEVSVTCRVPSRSDDNAGAHAVLSALLERGLFRSLREEGHLYAYAQYSEFLDSRVGLLTLRARVWPDQAQDTLQALLELLALARDVPDEVLAWSRLDAAAAHARSLGSGEATYQTLSEAIAEGRSPEAVASMPQQIAGVDRSGIARLLSDCVGHEAATVIGMDPGALPGAELVDWVARGQALIDSLR